MTNDWKAKGTEIELTWQLLYPSLPHVFDAVILAQFDDVLPQLNDSNQASAHPPWSSALSGGSGSLCLVMDVVVALWEDNPPQLIIITTNNLKERSQEALNTEALQCLYNGSIQLWGEPIKYRSQSSSLVSNKPKVPNEKTVLAT